MEKLAIYEYICCQMNANVLFFLMGRFVDPIITKLRMEEAQMREKAWFVFEPRRVDNLVFGACEGKWMEYEIVKTMHLSKNDYENFATDLLADRGFIEDNINLCQNNGDCLLIAGPGRARELLIIPWHGRFVRYAALRSAVNFVK